MRHARVRLIWMLLFVVSCAHASPAQGDKKSVEADPESRMLKPCGPSFFPPDDPSVGEEHAACLDEIAFRMQQDAGLSVVLDGHRDASEQRGISLTRANFARCYLVTEKGIAASRVTVRNFGDSCPHESGDRVLNKRVEHWLVPGAVSIDEITELKKCAGGSTPRMITDEKPAFWKGQFTHWEGDDRARSRACQRKQY